jgi:hypothetical protein
VIPIESTWEFWNGQFKAQIALLRGARVIVAIHDLDIAPSPDMRANRKRIELKFQQMQEYVHRTDEANKLKIFWVALVFKTAKALPFARYPSDARYKDWRLLSFERPDQSVAAGQPISPRVLLRSRYSGLNSRLRARNATPFDDKVHGQARRPSAA